MNSQVTTRNVTCFIGLCYSHELKGVSRKIQPILVLQLARWKLPIDDFIGLLLAADDLLGYEEFDKLLAARPEPTLIELVGNMFSLFFVKQPCFDRTCS